MKNTALSLVRHGLTLFAGIQVARGKWNHDTGQMVAGVGAGIVGAAWGAADEFLAERKAKQEKESTVPRTAPAAPRE